MLFLTFLFYFWNLKNIKIKLSNKVENFKMKFFLSLKSRNERPQRG